MTTIRLRYLAFAVLASCAATHHSSADTPKPRCGPGGPPGARCGPPTAPPPPSPPPAALVDASVRTVVSTTINGELVRAVSGRGKQGAFVTLERFGSDQTIARTPVKFEGVSDATKLDVIQLMWRTDRHGDLVFHLGADIGGWICHVESGTSIAKCVVARGGGRPTK